MLECDLHSHTIFSHCGVHTVIEMLNYAKCKGVKALAITDHGSAVGGRVNSVFWERLNNPVDGILLLKGLESNVVNEEGEIDFPFRYLKYADVILLGLHNNLPSSLDTKTYTKYLVNAIEKNKYLIDIISHPADEVYKIEFLPVVLTAKKFGIALELSNTKLMYNRISIERIKEYLKICIENEVPIALSSDAHTVNEVGTDNFILPILKELNFPENLVINSSLEKALKFLSERKKLKTLNVM